MDPATYAETANLKSGLEVRIRAIRPTDKGLILDMFRSLDTESVYTRFFYAKKMLTEGDLKMITEVDFKKVVAFVVTIGAEENETIIAGGRYACLDTDGDRGHVELAFLVREEYHGQGIASMLLQRLAQIAREKGIIQLEAEVLAQNRAMLAVFSHSGLPVKTKKEGGTIHVTMLLTGDAS